jgi:hypothetical protein
MEITVSQMTFQRRKAFSPKINNATFIWTSGREIVHCCIVVNMDLKKIYIITI